MKKGRIFFDIIIIISMIVLTVLIIYAISYYFNNYLAVKEAEEAVETFEKSVITVAIDEEENIINEVADEPAEEPTSTPSSSSGGTTYRGYSMVGTMQIPKTNVKIPIVDKVTPSSISAAVGVLYGPGPNEIGNTVYAAHNYRNGTFFSNNKNLVEGDLIYITDLSGRKVEYIIYKTYTTTAEDFSYATRNTAGKREISLSTCTTDPNTRLVIWAKES